MAVQDDARENVMVAMFNLKQAPDRARHDPDAFLDHRGHRFLFELKSTTKNSISTVRDFGPDHIEKWLEMHWIVGFFKSGTKVPTYCYYLTPLDMKAWTDEIWEYIKADFAFADIAANRINESDLYQMLGKKNSYSIEDAKSIQKKQYSSSDYIKRCDLPGGVSISMFNRIRCPFVPAKWVHDVLGKKDLYSLDDVKILVQYQSSIDVILQNGPSEHVANTSFSEFLPPIIIEREKDNLPEKLSIKQISNLIRGITSKKFSSVLLDVQPAYSPSAMLDILRDRCRYLIRRGSTLNNPHIGEDFFEQFDKIDDEHAKILREKLSNYLSKNPPANLLGELNVGA